MAGGNVVEIENQEAWDAIHAKSKEEGKAVVVDFWATWCGPCRMIGPYFVELSEEFTSVIFVKVDVDSLGTIAENCNISAMPTFQLFKDGAKVDEVIGASKEKLKAAIAAVA